MSLSEEQLYQQLAEKLVPGGRVCGIRPLAGGMSAEMTVFEIEEESTPRLQLVRRSFRESRLVSSSLSIDQEFQLLQITKAVGLATPTPYFIDLSGNIFAAPYMVIEYIDGEMLFKPVHLEAYLHQLATHLTHIHRANYAPHDLSSFLGAVDGCAELRQQQPFSHAAFHEDRMRQILSQHRPFPQHNPSTLLHGDYWPGNSLWQNGKLVAVIDWEDAKWGDPLIDLAVSRLDIAWIFGIEAMDNFTHHYQSLMPVDKTHLPYWDLCATLRFIRIFGDDLVGAGAFFVPFGRDDIHQAVIRQNVSYFIHQALARL